MAARASVICKCLHDRGLTRLSPGDSLALIPVPPLQSRRPIFLFAPAACESRAAHRLLTDPRPPRL